MNASTYSPMTLKKPTPAPIETLMHSRSVGTAATNGAESAMIVIGLATACRSVMAEQPDINLQTI